MSARRARRSYDHRLIELVREMGDPTTATRLGVPRSVAHPVRRSNPRPRAP
jgi:hypothetical protein